MDYYNAKQLQNVSFNEAIRKVTEALKEEGFGILTEIDVQATLKEKLDKEFRPYKILGACNPPFAFEALKAEDKIGTMLPCNVIVQQLDAHTIEVAAIDPQASMQSVENQALEKIAQAIKTKLASAIERL
uniref:DUF302 domain-containing protein n=1 Tax=Roseihalotalea indica TaxID=2867963 RepID=A0AA49GRI9_9BACT|nr:DUF302 domain-containing protein [Tunicatimonas sp. TK19036]